MRAKYIILHRKTLVEMFLEKVVLGIDLARAGRKSVIHAGDYNLNYFAERDRSLLQSVISPYDIKTSNFDTATRMTNSSSTLINYIITDDYETGVVEDTFLKTDHIATITVLKSVILNSKTTTNKFLTKKLFSHSAKVSKMSLKNQTGHILRRSDDMMLLEFHRIIERAIALRAPIKACYIRIDKPKNLRQEKWLCEKTTKKTVFKI